MKLNAQGIEQVAPFLDAIRFGSVVIIVLRESIVSEVAVNFARYEIIVGSDCTVLKQR